MGKSKNHRFLDYYFLLDFLILFFYFIPISATLKFEWWGKIWKGLGYVQKKYKT